MNIRVQVSAVLCSIFANDSREVIDDAATRQPKLRNHQEFIERY